MTYIRKFINLCYTIFLAAVLACNLIFVFYLKNSVGTLNNGIVRLLIFIFFAAAATGAFYIFLRKKYDNLYSYNIILFFIIFIGFTIRMITIFNLPCKPVSDYKTMFEAAELAAKGDFSGFSQGSYAQRYPHLTAYCVAVAGIFRLFGTNVLTVKIANVIMQTISICFISMVGKELFGKTGGLFSAFLYAVFPADIFYAPVMATENFAIPFFILSLFLIIKAYKNDDVKKTIFFSAASGAAIAAGSLMRSVYPFYLAAYVVAIVVLFVKWNKLFSAIALVLGFFIIFNAVSLGLYYSGVTSYKISNSGEPLSVFLLVGFNYDTRGMYSYEDRKIYEDVGNNPKEADKIAKKMLYERIVKSPERLPELFKDKSVIIWKSGTFDSIYWGLENNGYNETDKNILIYYVFSSIYFLVILVFSVIGSIFYVKRDRLCLLALTPLAFHCGLMLIEVQPRYTYSMAFIFILTAVSGFFAVNDLLKQRVVKK